MLRIGRQTLSLSYDRFFAEFLWEDSLDLLRLLASSTCVGLRYGLQSQLTLSFSCLQIPQYKITIVYTEFFEASDKGKTLQVQEYQPVVHRQRFIHKALEASNNK